MTEKINQEDVRHVAKLSRLKLSDQQIANFTDQLSNVLGFVSKLNELDVEAVEPMAHALEVHSVLREDVAKVGLSVDQAIANAPASSPPFFQVPKVLGDSGGA